MTTTTPSDNEYEDHTTSLTMQHIQDLQDPVSFVLILLQFREGSVFSFSLFRHHTRKPRPSWP